MKRLVLMIGTVTCALAGQAQAHGTPPPAPVIPEAFQVNPEGCVTDDSTQAEKAAAGKHVFEAIMAPMDGVPFPAAEPFTFAKSLGKVSQENIFENIWARCGLSRHDRSLLTLGILIGLRNDRELKYHFAIARRNGLSHRELEEVVIHASGYAGMPSAVRARAAAQEVLGGD